MEPDDLASRAFAPGECVWHYTTFEGLKGILTGTLWASSLAFLNDAQEFKHGIRLALKVLNDELSKHPDHPHADGFRAMSELIAHFYSGYDGHDVVVFSVSKARDDLSQWRAYGGGGPSFAIGFDPQALEYKADESGFSFEEVIYDNTESERKLADLLAPTIKEITEDFLTRGGVVAPAEDFARKWGPEIAASMASLAPRYKHETFAAEQEWRLVRRQGLIAGNNDLPLLFRRSGSLVVPYVEINIHEVADRQKWKRGDKPIESPIVAVMVGPNPHPEQVRYATSEMLARYGFGFSAVSSRVPFRNW